jgi:hypothetical protein
MLRNGSKKKELLTAIPKLKRPTLLTLFHSWRNSAISLSLLQLRNQFTNTMPPSFNAKLLLKVVTDPLLSLERKNSQRKE